jgi:Holliday junction resolvase-like predicted endonuclease
VARVRSLGKTCWVRFNDEHQRRQRRGRSGEAIAAIALGNAGWRILAHNHRIAGLEIDLVALDPSLQIVAVEVRRRAGVGSATPHQILGARKLAALRRQRGVLPALHRVDLLLVLGPDGRERLRLIRGIA